MLEVPVGTEPEDLPVETLEQLVYELAAGYCEQGFQDELTAVLKVARRRSASHDVGTDKDLVRRIIAPLALRVQGPVLEKYGLPPDERGVQLLKHMVRRRVAEGAKRLEVLGNKTRRLLDLGPMPDLSLRAEQFLAARADRCTAKLDEESILAHGSALEQCKQRIRNEKQRGTLSAAAADFLLQTAGKNGLQAVPAVMSLLYMAQVGMMPSVLRGDDVPSSVPVLQAPSPRDFWRKHVLPNRPAVLRGVVHPNDFRDIGEPELLRRLCGHRRVAVKGVAHQDESGRQVFVTDPRLRMPLAAFLDGLAAHSRSGSQGHAPFYLGKVALQTELPELAEEIDTWTSCPRRAYGSCFGELIPQGIFTYLGCGRNTTPVHIDPYENLMLCVRGTKRLLLYPPSDARFLYPTGEGILYPFIEFFCSSIPPFASPDQLPAELRSRFPLFEKARPHEVHICPGDLLYLPPCWWHCVEGSEEPNMILNWWFELHRDKKSQARAALSSLPA
eukprot:gnl/TRDRNA2_/TRDRNA2_125921_c0_seq2.p1 gnl/TRDRNA2_/TRDRNA2_125921_c0~~gnl/TRDRNA2_/TRDRNA2_125921_c0_seq2.p1  ORF type:complete len:501 (+),score=92.27 gnl/TRDRNA2_/TRDRNA2_125921_c0_seq2:21-1523(+)